MAAAGILEQVLANNPEHPGALHYAIHSYDDPEHALLGLRAARAYSKVAKGASHALHMPAHIYLPLGMWPEVIQSNRESMRAAANILTQNNASLEKFEENEATYIHYYHALMWLHYALLQTGQEREAADLLDQILADQSRTTYKWMKWYALKMRAIHRQYSDKFNTRWRTVAIDTTQLAANDQATDLFTRAWSTQGKISEQSIKAVEQLGSPSAKVYGLQLRVKRAYESGDLSAAMRLAKESTKLKLPASEHYGPPGHVLSPTRYYAEILLRAKQCKQALEQAQLHLQHYPGDRLGIELQESAKKCVT